LQEDVMGRTHKLLLTLTWLGCLAGQAQAEDAQSPSVGTLVRVTAPRVSKRRLTGTLVAANEQQIVLALPDSAPRVIPRSAVTRLERSRGYHRHPIPGAVVGGLLGGAFFGYASLGLCDAASCSVSLAAVGVGAALGALPGAGVGALIRTRDWAEVTPARVQISLAPVRGRGVAAQLSARF
jgi:hypothetical protein